MDKTMKTPVLLLLYNRPEYTQKLVERLRSIKPSLVYISMDGAKDNEVDRIAVDSVRKIVQSIDWTDNIITLINETNKGCRLSVSSAITWFFKQVDEGVILEGDCIPHEDFFTFSAELLEKYRDDNKIMHIAGSNFTNQKYHFEHSYSFASIPHVWGWATWKRAWQQFDLSILERLEAIKSMRFFNDNNIEDYWQHIFSELSTTHKSSWAYIWVLTLLMNKGLAIYPANNMVTNIGALGVHNNKDENNLSLNIPNQRLGKLNHPSDISLDNSLDSFSYYNVFNPRSDVYELKPVSLITKLKGLLL